MGMEVLRVVAAGLLSLLLASTLVEARELRVLHITDIHLDLDYAHGSNALCARPPCCKRGGQRGGLPGGAEVDGRGERREGDRGREGRASAGASNAVAEGGVGAGKLGSWNCDSPLALLHSALSAARSVKPDIIVWTGDTLPHDSGKENLGRELGRERALATISNATGAFRAAFSDYFGVGQGELQPGNEGGEEFTGKIFPVLGNYDFYPTHTDPGSPGHNWLTESLATGAWRDLLGSGEARRTFAHGGFYKSEIRLGATQGGARAYVIGLNTEVCHVKNYHAFSHEVDAQEQLEWLRVTLSDLESTGAKAILIGHIPPGLWSGCWGEYSEVYEEIVSSYTGVIAAQLYGHQHSGSFRVFYDREREAGKGDGFLSRASGVAYVTPSLTPFKNLLPSFRIYTIALDGEEAGGDQQTRRPMVTKFTQYFLDLVKYQAPKEEDVVAWYISFTAPQSLGIPNLAPRTWRVVADRLLSNKTVRDDYMRLEANGREGGFMGSKGQLRAYPCGVMHVANSPLMECSKQNEEQFIRDYTGKEHTYVLTTMFDFEVLMGEFCESMEGFLRSDCMKRRVN
ncbi:metallo-dependent phosphatase [Chloropicon primus]|uniref:Metallo-dependent phosphatase n=2 Tax=Chloropicon primus TaxID=1764295 RepID=A0A5B8MD62_9CHLO|nr:metallo-dependent phosphatase [Chloropicon primus]UPQ97554.1 metallo-dependent phosphatase [Chloropicon primus]|eukprot:QDZ18343.1 metallo-dependent phosphatase [Chloropicon primus]